MEFIQINKKRIYIYAETKEREKAIDKLLKELIEVLKRIQRELK